jgi:LmbE family N-acetylglucosaminyl deacetylase
LFEKPMNPYQQFAASYAGLIAGGKSLPLGGIPPHNKSKPSPGAPAVLLFSPHPDDECLAGGFALRLLREAGMRVINVAVTLGSNKERRQPRWRELKSACDWLGFDLEPTAPDGLEHINPNTLASDPQHWAGAVKVIASSLAKNRPRAIFFPHERDVNSSHVGTHFLVMDALKTLQADFQTLLVETEFWGQLASPNLMVESSVDDVGDLLAALSFHIGEVKRNPYHLRMPAWMQDNVRRGAELVGGQGGAAPDFMFATLYRARRWRNGRLEDAYTGGKIIGAQESPAGIMDDPAESRTIPRTDLRESPG